MGAVAKMFRQWPGTKRSDHPARSVATWGKHADYLTEHHLGNGMLAFMRQRDLVDFAVKWIEANRI